MLLWAAVDPERRAVVVGLEYGETDGCAWALGRCAVFALGATGAAADQGAGIWQVPGSE